MSETEGIKILIAGAPVLVRSALSLLLNREPGFRVVGGASGGKEALGRTIELRPDVLLLDLGLSEGAEGVAAVRKIKSDAPDTKVCILSSFERKRFLLDILRAGATGYITKDVDDAEFLRAVRIVADGFIYLQPNMIQYLVEEALNGAGAASDPNPCDALSGREQELFSYITKGYSNKEISKQLFISIKTVEAHKKRIMEKLNAKSLSDLMRYCYVQN